MYGQETVSQIDWSRYRLTPFRIIAICGGLLAIAVFVSIGQFSSSRDNILPGGAPVGGDYVAFYGAALAAVEGDAAAAYDYAAFQAHLLEVGPPREDYKLTWQYPPTYFLIILPLAFLSFIPGYIAWTGGTAALYFATMRATGLSWFFLFVIFAAPSAFQAVITGQNGFLTATLVALAALYPDKRPVLAGSAAALLTVKPQLGILIPIAYLAAGCWRAFAVATIGTVVLAGAATVMFGADIWGAFFNGASEASRLLGSGAMPIFKMVTPFAWLRYLGLPFTVAAIMHALCAIAAILAVARVWRQVPDKDLRAAALCAGIFFVAPYGYYYEMIILALPVAILAKRALETGWLKWEQAALSLMFIGPMMMPGQDKGTGLSYGFLCVVLIAVGVIRRIEHDHPGTFSNLRTLLSSHTRKMALER